MSHSLGTSSRSNSQSDATVEMYHKAQIAHTHFKDVNGIPNLRSCNSARPRHSRVQEVVHGSISSHLSSVQRRRSDKKIWMGVRRTKSSENQRLGLTIWILETGIKQSKTKSFPTNFSASSLAKAVPAYQSQPSHSTSPFRSTSQAWFS